FSHDEALRQRLADVERELADRKLIDRAKRLLMDRRHLSEHDAYAMLRKRAMDQGIRIVDAARQVLAADPQP
ncbi:ANTAR domain-containing response regulator, partial [Burkholderia ubonensis]